MENYKAKDIEAIMTYIGDRDGVQVDDIMANAGANRLRVYPIIAQLHAEGKLEIVETEGMGAPKVVRLKK